MYIYIYIKIFVSSIATSCDVVRLRYPSVPCWQLLLLGIMILSIIGLAAGIGYLTLLAGIPSASVYVSLVAADLRYLDNLVIHEIPK